MGDLGSIPGSRICPREGNGYPLQYSWGFPIANVPIKLWSPIPMHVGRGASSFSLQQQFSNTCLVQFSSVAWLCSTLCNPMDCSTPGLPVHHQLPEFTQTHVHWVGDAIQPSHPLSSLLLLPSVFSSIRVFSNESVLRIRWPKYWSFSFSISPSNEYLGLISFKMDWLDLLEVQGTPKSLLQRHSSKASILRHSAFFIVQLSHPYMTTGKTIALTRWTFVGKVMSLLFNMLSRVVITFLWKNKHLLISWLQSPSAVILEPKNIESATVIPFICHDLMGPDAMILVFWMLSFKPTFSPAGGLKTQLNSDTIHLGKA